MNKKKYLKPNSEHQDTAFEEQSPEVLYVLNARGKKGLNQTPVLEKVFLNSNAHAHYLDKTFLNEQFKRNMESQEVFPLQRKDDLEL